MHSEELRRSIDARRAELENRLDLLQREDEREQVEAKLRDLEQILGESGWAQLSPHVLAQLRRWLGEEPPFHHH